MPRGGDGCSVGKVENGQGLYCSNAVVPWCLDMCSHMDDGLLDGGVVCCWAGDVSRRRAPYGIGVIGRRFVEISF